MKRGVYVRFVFDDSTLYGHVTSEAVPMGFGGTKVQEVMDTKGRFLLVDSNALEDVGDVDEDPWNY